MDTPKYSVITGASSGIGYETAKAFSARGKNRIVVARRRVHFSAHDPKMFAEMMLAT